MPETAPYTVYDRSESDTIKGQLDIRAHAGAGDLRQARDLATFSARRRTTAMMICSGVATLKLFNGQEIGGRHFYSDVATIFDNHPDVDEGARLLVFVSRQGERGYHYWRGATTLAEALEKAVEISRSEGYYGKEVFVHIERHLETRSFADGKQVSLFHADADTVSGEPPALKTASIRDEVIAYLKANLSISLDAERGDSDVYVTVALTLDGEQIAKSGEWLGLG